MINSSRETDNSDFQQFIALVGNPNTGKSTLFNRLTGLRQRVGNYPGITVEKKTGTLVVNGKKTLLADLPGSYSLAASSPDERVVVDVLSGQIEDIPIPDMVICVVDATNLQRNLYLVSQIADMGLPMIIALNMMDGVEKQNRSINVKRLSQQMGVPVIPIAAARNRGIEQLEKAIALAVLQPSQMKPITWPDSVVEALNNLKTGIIEFAGSELSDIELKRILFDSDSAIVERVGVDREKLKEPLNLARKILRSDGFNPHAAEPILHYRYIHTLTEGVESEVASSQTTITEFLDRIVLHRFAGLAVFSLLMFIIFQAVYSGAGPMMDWIEAGKGWIQGLFDPISESAPLLHSLLVDGMVEGVGAVLIFLPQILILFGFVALLEDSGYMSRAAFLMDRLFNWCGMNGKSFVPLLSSYACAVPGVLAARTIEDKKARLITILIAPLMSCSARLPVYVLLIGAFVEPIYGPAIAGIVLFLMHFVGMAVAIPMAWFLNRVLYQSRPHPFILEVPPYRLPQLRDILWRMRLGAGEFLVKAGTIIFSITIIIWALLYFPHPDTIGESVRMEFVDQKSGELVLSKDVVKALLETDESLQAELAAKTGSTYIEQSILGRLGKGIQPLFAPAGFDWKITVGVMASFPAREVIIATLGTIYSLGGDVDESSGSLHVTLANQKWPQGSGARSGSPIFTLPVVFSIMIFFALCQQCGSTLSVIAQELNWRWAVFSFVYMTSLAWIGAVLCYQIGSQL